MELRATADIPASSDAVWAVLVDVERWPEWTGSVSTVRLLEPGPLKLGSTARIKQPKLPPATWRVTEYEPGSSFTWEARAAGVRTVGRHRITGEGNQRTTATVGITQHGPVGWLVGLLTSSLTRRYLTMEAEGLRRRCTSPPAAG